MITEPLEFEFFRRALAAALLASVACGIVGAWVVVKRMASVSGGLSHAAFGGVGLSYWLGIDPMAGAAVFAVGCASALGFVERRMQSSLDTLVAMVWAAGMAVGIVFVALTPGYAPQLMSYLFGSILFVPPAYLWFVAALDLVIAAVVVLRFRELEAVAFDEEFATVTGLPVVALGQTILVLVALSIVVLIRVVGVILVIALLTVPAATARQWTRSLVGMMALAAVLGAACSVVGLYASYWLAGGETSSVPAGPLIILLAVATYGTSAVLRRALQRPIARAASRAK
jgi:zinc transport system permease protein